LGPYRKQSPERGIPRHQRNRPADLWRHRSRRSLIVLGVAGFFAAWVCKIGRGISETPLRSSPTAAKSQSASVRIDARPRTTPQARALLVRRLKLRAGRASRDRWHATGLDIAPRQPSARPRPASTNQAATALRSKPPPLPGCLRSEEAPSAVRQSPVEQPESLLPLALTRVRFPANPREMSQKAVAIECPFTGYPDGAHDRNPQSRPS